MNGTRTLVLAAAMLLTLGLTTSTAADQSCKKVHSNVTAIGEFIEDPEQCNGYDFCQEALIRGTLNGTWWIFGNWADQELVADDTAFVWVLIGVVETKHGELHLVDRELFNLFAPAGLVAHSVVSGGTGVYEGATGWFAAILDFSSLTGLLQGEICWDGG